MMDSTILMVNIIGWMQIEARHRLHLCQKFRKVMRQLEILMICSINDNPAGSYMQYDSYM
jgi:hypothetical protein